MDTNSFDEIFKKVQANPRFWEEMAILDFTESVTARFESLGLNRTDLANKMGVSPAFITKLMCGKNNFTLRTMVKVAQSLDCKVSISLVPAASHTHFLETSNDRLLEECPRSTTQEPRILQRHFHVVSSVNAPRVTGSEKIDSPVEEDAYLALAA